MDEGSWDGASLSAGSPRISGTFGERGDHPDALLRMLMRRYSVILSADGRKARLIFQSDGRAGRLSPTKGPLGTCLYTEHVGDAALK